jgi:hypothetical protein
MKLSELGVAFSPLSASPLRKEFLKNIFWNKNKKLTYQLIP